ncbi:hypothetical protein A9P82_07635 [Arachidicoccus ginsenosidimutans]|uniref:Crp/Fnr family transcriptional regulator n=1 Tax=Arachidicoccus sp. BS20 TaxID=1850526 RepID=UPI0007F11624|nr:Crp/Fnr family transcriptional regulator [Arachidicoccus sp. BS20]ANI89173.1 hypothetical protein A9P82_07635 [Arachidicoccus sp. BS20]
MNNDKDYIKTLLSEHFPFFDNTVKDFICEHGIAEEIKAGTLILRSGKHLKYITLVADGEMKVYREGEDEGEIFLYYLEPGNACAFSLVCASKREISKVMIKAQKDSTIILVPVQAMETLMRSNKSWYRFVVETYRYRFDDLLSAFDSVVFKKLDERLEEYLQTQWQKNDGRPLELTHQQIADDLHSTREVISRLLKKMEQKGMLTIQRNAITMH